jgi:hypothetical protein
VTLVGAVALYATSAIAYGLLEFELVELPVVE